MSLIGEIIEDRNEGLEIEIALLIITSSGLLGGIYTLCFCNSELFSSRGSQRQNTFYQGTREKCYYILSSGGH